MFIVRSFSVTLDCDLSHTNETGFARLIFVRVKMDAGKVAYITHINLVCS